MWQNVQNSFYLNTLEQRAGDESNLSWCNQIVKLIAADIAPRKKQQNLSLNDIGCQYLQFYKALISNRLLLDYNGFDIDRLTKKLR